MDKVRAVANKVNVFNFLSLRFGHSSETGNNKTVNSSLTKYEYYIYKIQSVIIWEHRWSSLITLLLVNFLFWFLSGCCLYRVIFLSLLIWCACDAWIDHVWPEIRVPSVEQIDDWIHLHPWILSAMEVNRYSNIIWGYLNNVAMHFYTLHREQRSAFCLLMLFGFGLMNVIADAIGIYWSLYVMFLIILILPGVYIHLLPPQARRCLNIIVIGIVAVLMSGIDDNPDLAANDEIQLPERDELSAVDNENTNDNNAEKKVAGNMFDFVSNLENVSQELLKSGDKDSHNKDFNGTNGSSSAIAEISLTEEQKKQQVISFSDSLYNAITEKLLNFGRDAPRATDMSDKPASDHNTDDEFEFIEKEDLPDDFPVA